MKKTLIFCTLIFVCLTAITQNVGIGTTTPNAAALLHIDAGSSTKGFLITGTYNISSSVPDLGGGARFMFYPNKAAIRAGYVSSTQWDNANVGVGSTAFGYLTTASGTYSTSVGSGSIASGNYSTAMGYSNNASGFSSTALGAGTIASGDYSTSMGQGTIASGDNSFTAGRDVSTNNQKGSFFFGDSDPSNRGLRIVSLPNQFAARFNGGYYFISSNAVADIGVRVTPGGNSWSAISDVHRKENFLPIIGESVLNKITAIPLTTWNYKGQEKTFRHYGPMAQDFFAAFGKDDFGIIGCDTLINQQDFLGINLIAIQALEKRTEQLQKENEELKARLDKLEKLLSKRD